MNKIIEKISSGYWFLIEMIVQSVSILISVIFYTMGGNEFSILTHFISNLGERSAPNNAFIPFYIGIIIRCIFRIFIILTLIEFLSKKEFKRKKDFIISIIIVNIGIFIGSIFMIIYPVDLMKSMHQFGAIMIFLSSMLLSFLISIIIILLSDIKNYHAILGIFIGFFIILMAIIFLMPVNISIKTVMEWMVMFVGWVFYADIGILILRSKKKK